MARPCGPSALRRGLGLMALAAFAASLTGVKAGPAAAGPAAADSGSSPVVWLCKPGLPNDPCEIALDTTVYAANGTSKVVTVPRPTQSKRPIDCFYVYPTVSNQLALNATKAKDPEIYSIAKFQAARFSSQCRIFAPVYRQVTLAGIPGAPLAATGLPVSFNLAYSDIRQAWTDYLAHYNRGRGFVLIGHSQGSLLLRKLIRDSIDPNPALRTRMVGALLMGGNISVRAGRTAGGDFTHIPVCSRIRQYGCVVGYSTYSTDPLPVSFFGNTNTDVLSPLVGLPTGPGYQVACTDPSTLTGLTSPVGITIPSEPFAPGLAGLGVSLTYGGTPPSAKTTWVALADRYTTGCKTINGAHVLRYYPTPGSRTMHEFPPTWGTHLFDMNLGSDRLVRIVQLQAGAWLRHR